MQSEFVRFLGKGSYGSVYLKKYTHPLNGSWFHAVVKISNGYAYEHLEEEIKILSELYGYSNIVRCLGHELEEGLDETGHKVYQISLEYAPQGSLSNFMTSKYPDRKLPVAMVRVFTTMILNGLAVIHSHGYVHCDLKPDNILVFPLTDSSHELKISDFGNALEVGKVPDLWSIDNPYMGTPKYMPPESFREGVANKTLDLWSLGCVVLEMFTGEKPWKEVGTYDLRNLLLEGKAPEIPESLPCEAREFIEICFSRNPEDRGTALDLLSHRFLCHEQDKSLSETRQIDNQIVVEQNKRHSSWLLKFKLKLRITRALKTKNVTEKRPSKLNIFPSKPPQFKKLFNRFSRFNTMPINSLDFSLVSVR